MMASNEQPNTNSIPRCINSKNDVCSNWLNLVTSTYGDNRNVEKEVANLNQIANNECVLLYAIGSEINKLLEDLHNKDKEILNLREMVSFLSTTIVFFYNKMIEIGASKTVFKIFCQCASKSYLNHQKSINCKKQKSKNTVHRSIDTEEFSSELRNKLKMLEAENSALKESITQADVELEKFYEEASANVKEKDVYIQKYNQLQEAYTALEKEYLDAKRKWEATNSSYDTTIASLNEENHKLQEEISKVKYESELLIQAKNESIQELQDALREKGNRFGELSITSLLESEDCTVSTSETDTKATIKAQPSLPYDGKDGDHTLMTKAPQNSKASAKDEAKEQAKTRSSAHKKKSQQVILLIPSDPTKTKPEKDVYPANTTVMSSIPCYDSENRLEKMQADRNEERKKHKAEVANLKETIAELQKGIANSPQKTQNYIAENKALKERVKQLQCECTSIKFLVDTSRESLLNSSEALTGSDAHKKLFYTEIENNKLKLEISQLIRKLADCEKGDCLSREHEEIYRKEMDKCKKNLTDLMDKLGMMKELLQQKIQQYDQLEIKFSEQHKVLSEAHMELSENKKLYENQICILNNKLVEVQSKLTSAEDTCAFLQKHYKQRQSQVVEYSKLETKLQQCFQENIETSHYDIQKLHDHIAELQRECEALKTELGIKNKEVEDSKKQAARFKATEEEVITLKNELEKILEQYNLLRARNEALQLEVFEVKKKANTTYEQQIEVNEQNIKKYVCECQVLRKVRNQMATKNQECLHEIHYLRIAYTKLYKNYQKALKIVEDLRFKRQSRLSAGSCLTHEEYHSSDSAAGGSCSTTDTDNYTTYSSDNDEVGDTEGRPWLQKVNNITKTLYQSSEYWESKMSEDYLVTKDK